MERENPQQAKAMTLTVRLTDELGRLLRERASRGGQEPEEYVLHLIERDASRSGLTDAGSRTVVDASGIQLGQGVALSDAEFDQLLGDLSSGPELPHLPASFSRADIYADHD
jgi:hypothetical protein